MKHATLALTLIAAAILTGCGPNLHNGGFDTGLLWNVETPASIADGTLILTGAGTVEQRVHFPAAGAYRFSFTVLSAPDQAFLHLTGDFDTTFNSVVGDGYMQLEVPKAGLYTFRLGLHSASKPGTAITLDNLALARFSSTPLFDFGF